MSNVWNGTMLWIVEKIEKCAVVYCSRTQSDTEILGEHKGYWSLRKRKRTSANASTDRDSICILNTKDLNHHLKFQGRGKTNGPVSSSAPRIHQCYCNIWKTPPGGMLSMPENRPTVCLEALVITIVSTEVWDIAALRRVQQDGKNTRMFLCKLRLDSLLC
jgi:hypothetical protein